MNEKQDPKVLAEAVLNGELTLEAALEEHLDDDDTDMECLQAALCYANLQQFDKVLDVPGNPSVAELIQKLDLKPFARLVNDEDTDSYDEVRYPIGNLVEFGGEIYKVIGRRKVSIFAMPREDDFEVFLESADGNPMYFVGESLVSSVEEDSEDDE